MAKQILVPLDRSSSAEPILPLVAAIARGVGSTVRLLVVAPVPTNRESSGGRVVAYADQEMARVEAEALDYLRSVAVQLGDVADVQYAVRFGDAVTEILREANERGVDLIAVTTQGRSAVGRVVLGSVAEEIVRRADAPVMMVRPAAGALRRASDPFKARG
jgi:nucleotide-binding universal stress UspA family protein